jgi:hypothetical protein
MKTHVIYLIVVPTKQRPATMRACLSSIVHDAHKGGGGRGAPLLFLFLTTTPPPPPAPTRPHPGFVKKTNKVDFDTPHTATDFWDPPLKLTLRPCMSIMY